MTNPEPTGQVRPMGVGIGDEVTQLRRELEALRARPLSNAGEFYARTNDGVEVFRTGPYYGDYEMADGSPQWMTGLRDVNGQARIFLWDPDPVSGGFVQVTWMWDHVGNTVWTTDILGGWAEPHLPIVLYPRLTPPEVVAGDQWDYMWLNATDAGSERTCWTGCISYVSHPRIWVRGTWGGVDGGTGEYKLKINGTTVGTWTVAGLETSTKGPFGLLSVVPISTREVDVDLTARRSAGSGRIACQVSHCHQRQS